MRSVQSGVALAAVLGGLMAVCGCSGISSTVPLGKPVSVDQAKGLAGVWLGPEGDPIYVHHLGENRLKLAVIDWDSAKSKHRVEQLDCLVTQDDDQMYVNLLSGPEAGQFMPCSFARIATSEGDQLLVAAPRIETFAEAVADGLIAGKVTHDDRGTQVALTPEGSQFDDFVTPSKAASQFTIEKPLVLRRIKRSEDKQK
ncbi:hypothetical protein [Aeoliella sp. SH292]|uniref:hypothetical protein n=1 Tax=Aeoliella sp. SH292 TaxID=3454464 RepID=UPI003F96CF37